MNMKRFMITLSLAFILFSNPSWAQIPKTDMWYMKSSEMYTYDEMVKDIRKINALYGDLFLKTEIQGRTFDGRSLYHITVGSSTASKHILITGAIHGREYITAQLVMKQMLELCKKYENSAEVYKDVSWKDLLKDTAVHFVPMINPDGVTISQLGLAGLKHRVTRQEIYRIYELDEAVELVPYLRQWKANAKGVDLNRNFDALWEEYVGVQHPSSDRYKGTAPLCEVESKALADLTEQFEFERVINYHTQGQVIYWYFGQEGELRNTSEQFAQSISEITGYRLNSNFSALDPAGYKDWALDKKKIPSLTVEVGYGSNPVVAEQFPEIVEQNQDVIAETLYGIFTTDQE